MTTMKKLWAAAWHPKNAVYAIAVTAVLIVLALVASLQVGPVVSAAWQRHQMAKVLVWHPGPWALTVEDFPRDVATTMPVEQAWLGTWIVSPGYEDAPWVDEWEPSPPLLPAFRHLGSRPLQSAVEVSMREGRLMTSGVSVGDAQIFTCVLAGGDLPHSTHTITDVHRARLLDDSDGFRHVGDVPSTDDGRLMLPWDQYDDRDVSAGEHGYTGFTGIEVAPGGHDARRVTSAMTIVDGAFVLVGTSVPVGADPDPDLEIPALLDRIVVKVHDAGPASS